MTFTRSLAAMLRRASPFVALYLLAQFLIRLVLAVQSGGELSAHPVDWLMPFVTGLGYDLVVLLPLLALLMLYPLFLPQRWAGSRFDRIASFLGLALFAGVLLVDAVGEYLFWDEFTTRFNFIAVDYLIYTQEVLGNIAESYPIPVLVGIVVIAALAIAFVLRRPLNAGLTPHPPFLKRLAVTGLTTIVAAGALMLVPSNFNRFIPNEIAREVGGNGFYGFVYAFFHNEIEFARFYRTIPDAEAQQRVRTIMANEGVPLASGNAFDITRDIRRDGPMLRKNVIFVGMESLSAGFMNSFGNTQNLTPNLDRISKEGLFFTQMRATGTRTVRGLEALSMSVPPTPGQSILRRPGSDGRFTIGSVFQDLGYDTRFIYGGYGYFDNMNGFFSGNGFSIVDRGSMTKENVHFANAWGVSDEDLYDEVLRQGDQSVAAGKNFFSFVMNTSNHRPYTYPAGKIDIPSPGGRPGAVKYTDYAVGAFLAKAAQKPWFRDTVFVFVADHTASVAGKAELDMNKYHIPCIIWAPGFVPPQRVDRLTSQIDVAPTLLHLLNVSYRSRFMGDEVLSDTGAQHPVFISNYEKVAMIWNGKTTVLEPKKLVVQLDGARVLTKPELDDEALRNTIAFYQVASNWRETSKRIPTILPAGTP